jgi:hypothetical protein
MTHPFCEIAHSDIYAAVFSLFVTRGRLSEVEFIDAVKAAGGDDEDVTLIRHVMNLEGMRRENAKNTRSDYIWPGLQQIFQTKSNPKEKS